MSHLAIANPGRCGRPGPVVSTCGVEPFVPEYEVRQCGDLREPSAWEAWLKGQREDVKAMLTMAGFQYHASTDTISLVFANSALRCLTENSCEMIVDLIRSFYETRLKKWLEGITESGPTQYPPMEVIMPHLSIEIAPPFVDSH